MLAYQLCGQILSSLKRMHSPASTRLTRRTLLLTAPSSGPTASYHTKAPEDSFIGKGYGTHKDQASSCPGHPVIVRVVFEGRGGNDVHSLLPEFGRNITDHTTKGLHRVSKSGSIANPPTILLVATGI